MFLMNNLKFAQSFSFFSIHHVSDQNTLFGFIFSTLFIHKIGFKKSLIINNNHF